jgi:hypothetical protein
VLRRACLYYCRDFAATAVMQQPGGDSGGAAMSIRAVCIPKTQSLLEKHEGRHECAYNKSDGSRAVGVGYNLDDDPDTRRSEISGVLANYDKVRQRLLNPKLVQRLCTSMSREICSSQLLIVNSRSCTRTFPFRNGSCTLLLITLSLMEIA